jgi:hypothetical protein
MNAIELLILILATWRISHLFVHEDGFLHIAEYTRRLANLTTITGELFACVWCLSVWVGALFTVVWAMGGLVYLIPFSLSAGAILIQLWRDTLGNSQTD